MTATTGLIHLADVRDLAAEALAPAVETDPPVLVDVVDSLYPPALMLLWNDPWLQTGTGAGRAAMGPCLWTARLQVLCIGSRVEPGPGIRAIEQLVEYVVERLKGDVYNWPLEDVSGVRVFNIARIDYLAARVNYAIPTTV